MSTRCFIVLEKPDERPKSVKKYSGIYCQSDGYVSYVGLLLHCFYSDERLVSNLLGLGALSSLGPVLGYKIDLKRSYIDPEYYEKIKGQCKAYYRDSNESFEIVETNNLKDYDETYLYVFRKGEWYYRGGEAKRLSKLSIALKADKEIDDGLENYLYNLCDNDHKRIFIQKLKELGICKIKEQKLYDYTILGVLPNGEYRLKCNINNSVVEIDKEGILGLKEEGSTVDTTNSRKRLK